MGRPPKPETLAKRLADTSKKPILPWFKENSTLTEQEMIALREPLEAALSDNFYTLDQYIWYKTQDEGMSPVWSSADTEEVAILARVLLQRGKKSAAAATMVRTIVGGSDYVNAAVILLPRITTTVDRLAKAPKKVKREAVR